MNLPSRIAEEAQRLEVEGAVPVKVSCRGDAKALVSLVDEEVFWVAREALLNAIRHSRPTSVEVVLRYEEANFVVCISDDGQGMDAHLARMATRHGHWGLAGMHERARRIGGRLEVQSGPNEGTTVHLRVPGKVAYAPIRAHGDGVLQRLRDGWRQATRR